MLALPYLMEYPYECTEQTFNRLYANALARTIANSDPKIRRIFDQWKNTPALESPLQKNQDLKAVMIEETPWLRQAENESQARKNVGILFDDNRLNYETEAHAAQADRAATGRRLLAVVPRRARQRLHHALHHHRLRPAAAPGRGYQCGPGHPLAAAAGRVDDGALRAHPEVAGAGEVRAQLDRRALSVWPELLPEGHADRDRSTRRRSSSSCKQARKFWLKTDCRQTQGHLAIALHRFNALNGSNDATPRDIMKSIKERSVSNEEMGMFWRDTELSWWWYRAPDRDPGADDRGV